MFLKLLVFLLCSNLIGIMLFSHIIQVEKCSALENFLYNSCCSSGVERLHRVLPYWKMWAIWGRRSDHV